MDQIPPGTDLFQIPYQQPPHNVKSDFNRPSDLLNMFRALVSIMIFITTMFMILRIRARIDRDERWKMDDWLTTAAWMATTSLGILLVLSVQKLGRSTWDISLGFLMTAWPQRVLASIGFMVILSLLLGKLCLLALHYRFFGHIDQVRHQIYGTAALCFPLLASCIIFPVLTLPLPGKSWRTPNPYNKKNSIVAMAMGIDNILVDLLILYIPIPSIVSMNLSRNKKGGVLAIFLTGSMAIVADAVVMYYRVRLWRQTNPLRDGMIVGLCSFFEACISIVCSSMPCAAKVWKVHIVSSNLYYSFRWRFGSTQHSGNHGSINGPSEIIHARLPRARIRGLYSIGTLPTTNHSTTQLSKPDGLVELRIIEERHSGHHSTRSSVPENEEQGTLESLQRSETLAHSSLAFNDLSNYLPKHGNDV